MKKNKIFAFIFARSGSKGIKNKNIKNFNGAPLVDYTIKFAKRSKIFDKIILSSDNNGIIKSGKKNNIFIIKRPKKLTTDNSPELDSWKHAIRFLFEKKITFDKMVVLPCTSPLRIRKDITNAIKKLNNNTDIVFTICKSSRNPAFNMVNKNANGQIQVHEKKIFPIHRRQEAKKIYNLTTISYVTKPDYILKTTNLFNGKNKAIEIPSLRSSDIDEISDFVIAEILYKKLKIEKKW